MRYLIIIFLIFSYSRSNSQVITDEYSAKRDITFYKFKCYSDSIFLKRILTPVNSGVYFSSRKGRELLVAYSKNDEIKYRFEEIGGYPSLFLNKKSFKLVDINNNNKKELLIEIEPFESPTTLWIYTINENCDFHFIDKLILKKYSITGNELVITKNLISELLKDDTDTRFMFILNQLDLKKLDKVDYYRLINSRLICTNNLHTREITKRINDYKAIITQLNSLKKIESAEYEKKDINVLIKFLNKTISDYK